MSDFFYQKSVALLGQLSNSLIDKDPTNPYPVFFSVNEIKIVENFLKQYFADQVEEVESP